MLQQSTISFLSELALNNNKPWFDEHRDIYEKGKKDFEVLVSTIIKELAIIEPGFKEQLAKDCIFRIFRDVRFSKDKTPYKANFGAGFSSRGKNFTGAGYYLHLEPGKSFVGGGLWQPEAPLLKAIRQEIDYNFNEFKEIIENEDFKQKFQHINGERLQTNPKGYAADNPAIEFLKFKSFTVSSPIDDKTLCTNELITNCIDAFSKMKGFIAFLNKSLQ